MKHFDKITFIAVSAKQIEVFEQMQNDLKVIAKELKPFDGKVINARLTKKLNEVVNYCFVGFYTTAIGERTKDIQLFAKDRDIHDPKGVGCIYVSEQTKELHLDHTGNRLNYTETLGNIAILIDKLEERKKLYKDCIDNYDKYRQMINQMYDEFEEKLNKLPILFRPNNPRYYDGSITL